MSNKSLNYSSLCFLGWQLSLSTLCEFLSPAVILLVKKYSSGHSTEWSLKIHVLFSLLKKCFTTLKSGPLKFCALSSVHPVVVGKPSPMPVQSSFALQTAQRKGSRGEEGSATAQLL